MKNILFLWDYIVLFDTIKKCSEDKSIIIVDSAKKKYPLHDYLKWFDYVYEVNDIFDREQMNKLVDEIIQTHGSVDALISPYEALIEMAGFLRDQFEIHGMNGCVAKKVRDKELMKTEVQKAGIKTAKIKRINCIDDLINFIKNNNYPIIVKPVSGFTTINTFKITNLEECEIFIGDFLQSEQCSTENDQFVVESFVEGEEYCCDSIVKDGKTIFSTVTKYLHNCLDTVIDSSKPGCGIMYPMNSEKDELIKQIKNLNQRVVTQLGIINSICHMEVFVDQSGELFFSEIGARLGGGAFLPLCLKNSYGVDFYKAFVDLELGRYEHTDIVPRDIYSGVIMFPFKQGRIKKISIEEDFKDLNGLVSIKIYKKVGDTCRLNAKSSVDATGIAVMEDSSFSGVKERLLQIYNCFELEVCDVESIEGGE
nr:ATP-grasp domain-containing protein [uncultured Aminipila sp.]